MISSTILIGLVIAAIGWLATIRLISTSQLSRTKKRTLLIPSWFAWLGAALVTPFFIGMIPLSEMLNIGGAVTMGVIISALLSFWR